MKTNTRDRIVEYIRAKGQVRVYDLVRFLTISNVAVHKQLNVLLQAGILQRAGTPPLVFYSIVSGQEKGVAPKVRLGSATEHAIVENFLSITPQGQLLYGMDGFLYWAREYQQGKDLAKLAEVYALVIKQKRNTAPHGWIEATEKMTDTFGVSFIDRLLFADVYSHPLFGRTKLATLVMHAKQSQNKALIDEIAQTVKPIIEKIILRFDVNAIGFIPPTVPRPLQFMDELSVALGLRLPRVDVVKIIPGQIPVPQKTLTRLQDRVVNAKSSIYLREAAELSYPTVLLIDDVAGSGASFQETAKKIKTVHRQVTSVIAFAIVGNIKGYDIIRQI
ncbi:winged helix-turn-helix transcriptional regulator [Candidatus Gottesmanbacteria bacterium]|nr:winged helix-turn-helix transcriptional regulator [Candidatus Gottesmanbacteria bacterium]